MSETAASYGELLLRRGCGRGFAAGLFARLSNATVPLALILCVHKVIGSFAFVGLVLGVFSIATMVGPLKARLADRYGRRAVLVPLGLATGAAEGAIALAAAAGVRFQPLYILLAAVAGALAPPLGAVARALWSAATPLPADRARAYNLDTIAEETLYTAGPLIVALALVLGGAVAPLVVSAVALPLGTIGLVLSLRPAASDPQPAEAELQPAQAEPQPTEAEPQQPAATPAGRRPLLWLFRNRGFTVLTCVVLGFGLGLGPIDVATAAQATDAGHTGSAGVLLAGLSVGSVAGGLLWDRMRKPRRRSTQLLVLLGAFVLTSAAAGLLHGLVLFGVALVLLGTAVSPLLVVAYVGADELVPEEGQLEASTWLNTANNVGVAVGATGAGLVIDHGGPGHAILAGTAVLAVALLMVLFTRGTLDAQSAGPVPDAQPQALATDAA